VSTTLEELLEMSRRMESKLDELTRRLDARLAGDELTIDRGVLQVLTSDDPLQAIRAREKSIRREGRRARK
jgi:hypothetical protein